MTEIVGGLRARLLTDSLFEVVGAAIADLGWLDAGRRHRPLHLLARPAAPDEAVAANTMTMSADTTEITEWELGSGLTQDETSIVFDFYAEDDSIGLDLSNDVRDILRGRLGVGPQRGTFPIYDYRLATPVKVGYVSVTEVRVERPPILNEQAWRRHWFQIRAVVQDAYTDTATAV